MRNIILFSHHDSAYPQHRFNLRMSTEYPNLFLLFDSYRISSHSDSAFHLILDGANNYYQNNYSKNCRNINEYYDIT